MKSYRTPHFINQFNLHGKIFHAISLLLAPLIITTLSGCLQANTPTSIFHTEIYTSSPSPVAATQAINTSMEEYPAPNIFNFSWSDRSVFKNGLAHEYQDSINAQPGATIYHIDLNVADNLREVDGTTEILYTNQEDAPLSELQIHLFPNILGGKMEINSAQLNEIEITPVYGLENSLMRLTLDQPLNPGEKIVISMQFIVTVPEELGANYGVFSAAEDVLAYAHGYPMVAVYDALGWNSEIPSPSGDVTYNDACFYLVRITAPDKVVLAASGIEIERNVKEGKQQITYASGPARDFYFAASDHYIKTSLNTDGVQVSVYTSASNQVSAETSLEIVKKALRIFSQRYAPYPYSELDLVTTPTLAFGIEYPGVIAINDQLLVPNGEIDGVPVSNFLESTIAHEVGHQWFYNLIGNDQLNDPWLDESLTQFATLQYFSDSYGATEEEGFRDGLEFRWSWVDNAKIPMGLPVRDYTDKEYSAIVYGRGGLFFEALRDKMGEEAFDDFLREYAIRYSWEIATTDEFKSLAEQNCQCKLDSLFQEWVFP